MQRPVIIGGGVAGLMAAIHLAERGSHPVLLEANPDRLGGRLKNEKVVSLEHNSQVWHFPGEHGVHGIWSPYLNLKAVLTRHHILPAFVPAREETWVFGRGKTIRKARMGSAIRGSVVPAPFHYLHLFLRPAFLNILTLRDLASLFRTFASLLSAMSIDPIAEHKSLRGMSLADFMAGWSPTLRSFFAGLARNALAGHPEDVPASGFIAFLRFYTLLRRDAWAFSYLPGPGGDCVIEPLREVACRLGVEIRLGARVTMLEQGTPSAGVEEHALRAFGGGRGAETISNLQYPEGTLSPISTPAWRVTYQNNDQSCTLQTDQIILAVDAPAAQKLLAESPATQEGAAKLWFPSGVPTAIFRLWFKVKPKPIAEAGIFTGDFVMDNFFWLDRLQPAFSAWSQATGGSAIEMHIYGPPELLAQPDASLLAQVIVDIYRAFPELRGQLLHSVLQRNEAAHTLFSVGEPGRHLGIETPWAGLWACGDWVYHPAPALYLERAAATGIAAANAVLTSLELEPWPILPHPEPEWLAGKMEKGLRWARQTMLKRRHANR
ncbi:MAG: FAD-dependent oxidoreductase [Anaerolineae bacterium]